MSAWFTATVLRSQQAQHAPGSSTHVCVIGAVFLSVWTGPVLLSIL